MSASLPSTTLSYELQPRPRDVIAIPPVPDKIYDKLIVARSQWKRLIDIVARRQVYFCYSR